MLAPGDPLSPAAVRSLYQRLLRRGTSRGSLFHLGMTADCSAVRQHAYVPTFAVRLVSAGWSPAPYPAVVVRVQCVESGGHGRKTRWAIRGSVSPGVASYQHRAAHAFGRRIRILGVDLDFRSAHASLSSVCQPHWTAGVPFCDSECPCIHTTRVLTDRYTHACSRK